VAHSRVTIVVLGPSQEARDCIRACGTGPTM